MNPLIGIEQLVLLSAVLLAAVGTVAWRASFQAALPRRLAMTAARVLAVVGVLVLLVNPGAWRERMERADSTWAFLLDRSSSMATPDAGPNATRTRWTEAVALVRASLRDSERPETVQLYTFADGLAKVARDQLDTTGPDGPDTRIVAAGRALLDGEQSRRSTLRGIVLLSDGRQPSGASCEPFALRAAACGAPVYPLMLGGVVPARDLALHTVRRRYVGFQGQPVTVTATLRNEGMGPVQAQVALRAAGGDVLEEQTVFVTNRQSVAVSFVLRPDRPGYYEYSLETPLREQEADRANNSLGLGVFLLTEHLNVLILEGEPYWDTKFLSHLLRAQKNMRVTAVFRVSKDRLFRVSTDTALAAASEDAFPATDAEMAEYDLVVLGRGTEYLIDEPRAWRLERFVRDHAGCVFFTRGKSYHGSDSALADLEPVLWGKAVGSSYALQPLLAGEQAGLFGGVLPERASKVWQAMPPLERAHYCESLKSFVSVLAEGVPRGAGPTGKTFPALVTRRFGRGLVIMVNGDGLWKWGFYPNAGAERDIYRNLWVRLFQWAVSFLEFNPGSDFAVHVDRATARIGEAVRVQVSARVQETVEMPALRVYRGATPVQAVALAAEPSRDGAWLGLVRLNTPGIYRIAAETQAGRSLDAQATVQVVPPPGETDELSADPAFLDSLAALSGGRRVTRGELPALVKQFETPVATEQRGDVVWDPAWDSAWAALALLLLFALEWYWRRRQGLL